MYDTLQVIYSLIHMQCDGLLLTLNPAVLLRALRK